MYRLLLAVNILFVLATAASAAFHLDDIPVRYKQEAKAKPKHKNYGFLRNHKTAKDSKNAHNIQNHQPGLPGVENLDIISWTFPILRESDLKLQEDKLQEELQSLYIKAGNLKHELEKSNKNEKEAEAKISAAGKDSADELMKEAERIGLENAEKAQIQTEEMKAEKKLLEDRVHRLEETEDAEAMREKSKIEAKEKLLKAQEDREEMAEIAHDAEEKAKEEAEKDLECDPAIKNALKEKEKAKAERALLENAEEEEAASVVTEHEHQLARNAERSAMDENEEAVAMADAEQHSEEEMEQKNAEIENAWQQEANKKVKQLEENAACDEAAAMGKFDKSIKNVGHRPCAAKIPAKHETTRRVPHLAAKFEHPEKFHLDLSSATNTERPQIIINPVPYVQPSAAPTKHEKTAEVHPPENEKEPHIPNTPIKEEKAPVVAHEPEKKEKTQVIIIHEPPQEERAPIIVYGPPQENRAPIIVHEPNKEEKAPVIVHEPERKEKQPEVVHAPRKEEKAPAEGPTKDEEHAMHREKKESITKEEADEKKVEEQQKYESRPEKVQHQESAGSHGKGHRREKWLESPTGLWVYMFVVFPICIVLVLFSLVFFT